MTLQYFANVMAGFIVIYLLFSYFAVNPLAKKLVPRVASSSFDSVASVEQVDFDPYRLKATLHDFKLANKAGEELVGFKKLVIDFELSGMFDLAWKFQQIGLLAPRINIAIAPDGKFNWHDLLAKINAGPAQPPSDTVPSVIIEHFVVNQGNLHYADTNRPEPIETTLAPLNFHLKGFSTVPKDRGDYLISAAFSDNGGILKWKGNMGVNPVASTGVIALEGVKIAEALSLVKGLKLPIEFDDGAIQTSFNYDFSMPKEIPTVGLTNITFSLTDVNGSMNDGGKLSLTHAGLLVPRLDFVKNQYPELHLQNLDFKLLDLNVSQNNGLELAVKEALATMPNLDFSLVGEAPKLVFNDLNIKVADIFLNQENQIDLRIPTSELNNINLDLAKNKVNINEILISTVSLDKHKNLTEEDAVNQISSIAILDKLALDNGVIGLADKTIRVNAILLSGLTTSVVRNSDASINWVELFKSNKQNTTDKNIVETAQVKVEADEEQGALEPSVKEAASTEKVADASWSVSFPKIALNDANIHFQDNFGPSPVVLDVQDATIELNNASLDITKPLPVKAAFKLKQGGQFSTKGQLWPSPLKVDLGLQLSKFSLKPFAPYLNQFALLKLNNGTADVSGKLNLIQKQDLALTFNGKFAVNQLAVIEEDDDKPFLSWNRLGSNQLKFTLAPDALKLGVLNIDQPSAKFIIYEDKTTNLSRILRSRNIAQNDKVDNSKLVEPIEASLTEPTNTTVNDSSLIKAPRSTAENPEKLKEIPGQTEVVSVSTADESFPISIDSVRLNNAKLEFADLWITPQFGTNIHSLNGVINGLSTKAKKIAQVEMEGKVNEYGSAKISGSFQPLNVTNFIDINLAFKNLDMSNLTPYSGKFAGRYIDSGKLSVDLEYKIKQKQLVGENKFVINKLKLGEKVKSDTAADLPLDLAIAILEDSDGVIDLDLPISGSLDNPEFSFASVAWKAFRNVISKVVTAPFRVLGKLFGGKGGEFDSISFDAGDKDIAPPELEKLMKVTEVLKKRKGLSLAILPGYSSEADTKAIQAFKFRLNVMKEMGVELAQGQKPGPIDLENEDVQKAIDALYNDLTNKGLLKRLVSKFEEPEEGHFEKAKTKLIESIEVTDQDLQALAIERGTAIQQIFIDQSLDDKRVVLAKPKKVDAKAGKVITQFELNIDKNLPQAINDEMKEKRSDVDAVESNDGKSTKPAIDKKAPDEDNSSEPTKPKDLL